MINIRKRGKVYQYCFCLLTNLIQNTCLYYNLCYNLYKRCKNEKIFNFKLDCITDEDQENYNISINENIDMKLEQ